MSFDYNFFTKYKKQLETNFDKFKSTYEFYDTTYDTSFVTLNNMDTSYLTLLDISSNVSSEDNCKAYCDSYSNCNAYSLVDSSCNIYSNINSNLSSGDYKINIIKNASNLVQIAYYMIKQNTDIKNIAINLQSEIDNYETSTTRYYYDANINDKQNLDLSFNELQYSKKQKRNLIATQESNPNSTLINTYYLRYLFLFSLMFLMLILIIYLIVNNAQEDNVNFNNLFYLVLLFVILFSVCIIYLLK
jgi:hypothetical protein